MENVADALRMAADVLVFIMALGISILSFSQAKQTAQVIVQYTDREYTTQYAEDIGVDHKDRIVGVESIIPTIWRSFNEDIRVVIYENDTGNPDTSTPMDLFTLREEGTTTFTPVNYVDLETISIGAEGYTRNNFIMTLLYGKDARLTNADGSTLDVDDYIDQIRDDNQSSYSFITELLQNGGLYGKIKGKEFRETIGIYYREELEGNFDVPQTNRHKIRVISYYQQ